MKKKEQSKGAAPFLTSYNFYMKYDIFNIVGHNCKTVYDYIVPVPSSVKKINKRGYNQVDLFSVIGPSPYKTSIISILFG